MSNGLCKTLEDATGSNNVNADIARMVAETFPTQNTLNSVAQAVVDSIERIHHDAYARYKEYPQSNYKDGLCAHRKDITLLIRNFNYQVPHVAQTPIFSTLTSQVEAMCLTNSSCSTTMSRDDQKLFMIQQKTLEYDENKHVIPYCNFSDYNESIENLDDDERAKYEEIVKLPDIDPDVLLEEDELTGSTISSTMTDEDSGTPKGSVSLA